MNFLCPDCLSSLEQTGKVDIFACVRCRCIYCVRIQIDKVAGPLVYDEDLRKLALPEYVGESDIE